MIKGTPEQKQILKELPVRHKTVIYLHYVEGYSVKQMRDAVMVEGGI